MKIVIVTLVIGSLMIFDFNKSRFKKVKNEKPLNTEG